MGILNVTPDSFYEKSRVNSRSGSSSGSKIIDRVKSMLDDGADIIDVGGVSTRPGASEVSEEEELKRLIPAIKTIHKEFPKAVISADTFRSKVAVAAAAAGASIINDISGGTFDKNMMASVGKLGLPYVLMHIKGTPADMQKEPKYKNVVKEVKQYFEEKLELAAKHKIKHLILDPGFGFGKTLEHNYELLSHLDAFHSFKLPILVGISRKSMVTKALGIKSDEALNGTTALNTIALLKGAKILRVHDVKEAVEVVKLTRMLK